MHRAAKIYGHLLLGGAAFEHVSSLAEPPVTAMQQNRWSGEQAPSRRPKSNKIIYPIRHRDHGWNLSTEKTGSQNVYGLRPWLGFSGATGPRSKYCCVQTRHTRVLSSRVSHGPPATHPTSPPSVSSAPEPINHCAPLSRQNTNTHTGSAHLALYFCEGVAEFSKLGVAVRVVAEQAVEELEAVRAGGFHQPQRAREALRVNGRPREPLQYSGVAYRRFR